jgi:hypothetical protein
MRLICRQLCSWHPKSIIFIIALSSRQAHAPVRPDTCDGLTLSGHGKKVYKPNDHFYMVTTTISAADQAN